MSMSSFSFLLLAIFIVISDCFPVGNDSLIQRKDSKTNVKFPLNSRATAVRSPPGGWARDRNTTSRISAAEEQFVFPDDDNPPSKPKPSTPPTLLPRFKPTITKRSPPCAKGSTFCETVDDYPGSYLENVFQNSVNEFLELLGTDELKTPPISQRFDGDPANENPLCASVEQVVFPKTAKTKDDKWLYVVNQASYIQGVRVEKCLKTSDSATQSCFFTESFPIGYKTSCKQKYIYRKLVALNEEGKPITDIFQLPSCCSCSVTSDGLNSRQGVPRKASNISTTTSTTTTLK